MDDELRKYLIDMEERIVRRIDEREPGRFCVSGSIRPLLPALSINRVMSAVQPLRAIRRP